MDIDRSCGLGDRRDDRSGHATIPARNLFGTGYGDKQVAPDTWDVRGASATPEGGHSIALYRAAELVRASGASELRIIRQKIVTISRTDRRGQPMMFVREVAKLRIRAVRGDGDRMACEEKEARRCVTIPVARLLAQFGPPLGRDAGADPAAVAALPAVRVSVAPPLALARRSTSLPIATPPAVVPPPPRLSSYELGRQQARAALAAMG